MNEKEKLEQKIIEFIEETMARNMSGGGISILPEMVHELIELQKQEKRAGKRGMCKKMLAVKFEFNISIRNDKRGLEKRRKKKGQQSEIVTTQEGILCRVKKPI